VLWCCGLGLNRNGTREKIKWARRRTHFAGGDPEIASGSCQAAVTEQQLNGTDIRSGFE
jgi:hypothetical protein